MIDTSILGKLLQAYLLVFTAGYGSTIAHALWLLKMFVTLEVALIGIWWAMSEDSMAGVLLSKILAFGVLTWLLTSWPSLMDVLQRSFIKWGIVAGGGVITVDDFRNPGSIFSFGAQVGVLMLDHLRSYTGWGVLFNGVEIAFTGVLTLWILVAFAWMTIQVAVAMIEWYLGAIVAVLLLPFGAFRHLAFLTEKALGYVLALGIKLAILAFLISCTQLVLTVLKLPPHPSIEQVLGLTLGVGFIFCLSLKAPAWTASIMAGVAAFSAASVAQAAIGAGALAGTVATRAGHLVGASMRGVQHTVRGSQAVIGAAQTGGMRGVGQLAASAGRQLAVNTGRRFTHPAPSRGPSTALLGRTLLHE